MALPIARLQLLQRPGSNLFKYRTSWPDDWPIAARPLPCTPGYSACTQAPRPGHGPSSLVPAPTVLTCFPRCDLTSPAHSFCTASSRNTSQLGTSTIAPTTQQAPGCFCTSSQPHAAVVEPSKPAPARTTSGYLSSSPTCMSVSTCLSRPHFQLPCTSPFSSYVSNPQQVVILALPLA